MRRQGIMEIKQQGESIWQNAENAMEQVAFKNSCYA